MDSALNKPVSDSTRRNMPPTYVATRNKKPREDDFKTDLDEFKKEMKSMIASLLSVQEKELQKISSVQKDIQHSNANIENSVAFIALQNEQLQKKIETLECRALEDRKYIAILENKIEDMQRGSRKANFEMKNVPKQKKETKEDLVEMVTCLAKNIGCSLTVNDIKDVYRVQTKKEGVNNAPIVVETISTLVKTDLLKMTKAFNVQHKTKLCAKHLGLRAAEDTPIFISEQLTAKASRLHFLARDLAKSKSYKFCWTAYGKVYVRRDENSPIITISNEPQVQQLMQS